jgi:hypothetical protein
MRKLPDNVARERRLAKKRAFSQANRDEIAAQKARWRAANQEIVSARNRLRNYGLTEEASRALLASQRGLCAVCAAPIVLVGRSAFVDHDHATGQVRGFLCHGCNLAIGHMKDSPMRLRKAAAYLEKHRPKLRLA